MGPLFCSMHANASETTVQKPIHFFYSSHFLFCYMRSGVLKLRCRSSRCWYFGLQRLVDLYVDIEVSERYNISICRAEDRANAHVSAKSCYLSTSPHGVWTYKTNIGLCYVNASLTMEHCESGFLISQKKIRVTWNDRVWQRVKNTVTTVCWGVDNLVAFVLTSCC
jgi:hypothetical protein